MRLKFKATKWLRTYESTDVKAYGNNYVVEVSNWLGNRLLQYFPNNWELVTEPALSVEGYMPYVEKATEPTMNEGDIKLWHNTTEDTWQILWKQEGVTKGMELGKLKATPRVYHGADYVRTATLVVAASDSSAKSKAQADYVCDGTHDNIEIQAAIDALPAGGGKVVLLKGTFTIHGRIRYKSDMWICGSGRSTIIKFVNGAGETRMLVQDNKDVARVMISDMTLDGNKANLDSTFRVLLVVQNYDGGYVWLNNIYAKDSSGDCIFITSKYVHIDNVTTDNYDDTGLVVGGRKVNGDIKVPHNVNINNYHSINGVTALNFANNAQYINASNLTAYNCRQFLNFQLTVNGDDAPHDIMVRGFHAKGTGTSSDATGIGANNTDNLRNITIRDGIIEEFGNAVGGTSRGIYLVNYNAGTTIKDILIENVTIKNIAAHGIEIIGGPDNATLGHNIMLHNLHIFNNGQRTTGDGIRLERVEQAQVIECQLEDDQETATQRIGLNISTGTTTILLRDCYFNGNTLSPITDFSGGTATPTYRNNSGWVTENSGTATLLNGNTSIVVTHGLDVTPAAGDIMVTPIESLGAASKFYIDTYTSTQFTIHVNVNPTQDVDFAWKAAVL